MAAEMGRSARRDQSVAQSCSTVTSLRALPGVMLVSGYLMSAHSAGVANSAAAKPDSRMDLIMSAPRGCCERLTRFVQIAVHAQVGKDVPEVDRQRVDADERLKPCAIFPARGSARP